MAIFKCKICGGTLEINVGETVATCECCGTKQTLPKLDDEKKANLFDRANHFRRNNDFDKAMSIYEQILNEDTEDAESYWSIVLCRYGIEYVEDPSTHKRVPTVNRAQFTSVFDDEDYKSAIKYADNYQKDLYEQEARTINEIQKGILAISGQEEPFDVFICYKESDNSGRRTPDSVLATELYHELTREGFKVFFSRITLEDKLGTAYEPYIFAALHSSKVMVVLGTRPEYFNSVWVKNEWSRYLALIKNGARKILIPAYRDMDPYDLPEEFSHLQAQDMSKLGFMQDLIRGINKIIIKKSQTERNNYKKADEVVLYDNDVVSLLDKSFLFLEDKNWKKAKKYLRHLIEIDPKNSKAYLGLLLLDFKIKNIDDLKESRKPFNKNRNFEKAIRFGDISLVSQLEHVERENTKLREEQAKIKKARRKKAKKVIIKCCAMLLLLLLILLIAIFVKKTYIVPYQQYRHAITLYEERQYDDAYSEFIKITEYKGNKYVDEQYFYNLGKAFVEQNEHKKAIECFSRVLSYEDAKSLKNNCMEEIYQHAKKIYNDGSKTEATKYFMSIIEYKDAKEIVMEINANTIAQGSNHLVAVKEDGTVVATGNNDYGQCNVDDWSGVVSVVCDRDVTIGLKSDGTVLAVGENEPSIDGVDYNVDDFNSWNDIISIYCDGQGNVYGLRTNGTVVYAGNDKSIQADVSNWCDIVGVFDSIALKSDGTVVVAGSLEQDDFVEWKDIIDIVDNSLGLKSDGTVVLSGDFNNTFYISNDIERWHNIRKVKDGTARVYGITKDGQVIVDNLGSDDTYGLTNVSSWKNIEDIYFGPRFVIGLKTDGSVIITKGPRSLTGKDSSGKITTVDWSEEAQEISNWDDIVCMLSGKAIVGLKSNGTVLYSCCVKHNGIIYNPVDYDVSSWKNIKMPFKNIN